VSARKVLPIDSLSKLERGALCKLLLAGGRALYTSGHHAAYDKLVDGGYALWVRGAYALDVDNIAAMQRANGLK
jgi:hypothetical protein